MTPPKSLLQMREEWIDLLDEYAGSKRHARMTFDAGTKAVIERASVLVDEIKTSSEQLDGIEYDLEASVYTLTDDEFETVFFVRDKLFLLIKEWENFTKGEKNE